MAFDLFSGRRREPAGCAVRVGSARREIADLYPFLTEVRVETGRRDPWTATLTFESRRDERGRWAVQDSGVLEPWEPVVIEATFGSSAEEVMRGYIREVQASYPEEAGAATVTVECQDESLPLDREHVRETWGEAAAPTTDGLIFKRIAVRHNLTPESESGQGLSGLVLYQDTTDARFLRDRAEANGYELIFSGGGVYFGPMRLQGQAQPAMMVYAGPATNCRSFTVRADGHQPERVAFERAASEGAETEEETMEPDLPLLGPEAAAGGAEGGAGLRDFVWRMRREGGTDAEALRAHAQALANELSLRVRAEGELDGSLYGAVLRAGRTVAVDGVGEKLSGVYYVDTVTHRFSADGYAQSFRLLRNAYGDNVPTVAAAAGSGLINSLGLSLSASAGV